MRHIQRSKGERAFRIFNFTLLAIFGFVMLLPLLTVAAESLSNHIAVDNKQVFILPVGFNFDSWVYLFKLSSLWKSLGVTVSVTVLGTFLALFLNALMAYPLSKKEFKPSRAILLFIVVSIVFKAPIMPYFLAVKDIGLFDNYLVLFVPFLFDSFNLIILVTFLRQVPKELEEAAMIEGCGYTQILFRIVLPSSKAALATVGLFYAVGIWNQFTNALLFIQDYNLYPLQLLIRSYVVEGEIIPVKYFSAGKLFNDKTIKAASIIFTALPIIMVYPSLQKYFIKGAMIGSIKG